MALTNLVSFPYPVAHGSSKVSAGDSRRFPSAIGTKNVLPESDHVANSCKSAGS